MRRNALAATVLVLTAIACGREPAVQKTATAAAETSARPATPPAAAAVAPVRTPERVITELYREHSEGGLLFHQADSRARVDHYFEKSLADLIWNDATDPREGAGALDFDPLYNAQDFEPKNLTVHPAHVDGDTARVRVTFDSYGQKYELTFLLARSGDAWKIRDIDYGDEATLRGVYRH